MRIGASIRFSRTEKCGNRSEVLEYQSDIQNDVVQRILVRVYRTTGLGPHHFFTAYRDFALIGGFELGEAAQQRGFTRARRADNGNNLSLRNL